MPEKNNKNISSCLSFFIFLMLNIGIVNLWAQTDNSSSALPIPDFIYEMRVEEAWKDKDFKKAQSLLEDGLKSYPENSKLWDYQAGVASQQKDYEKSIEAANKALRLSPNPVRHSNVGWFYYLLKQYKKATRHFKLGLKHGLKWNELYFYLGECLERTGQKHEAVKYYQQYLNVASVGSGTIETEKRLALLQQPGMSGGFGMTAAQKRQQDARCGQEQPGLIAVDFNPLTKEVKCGCPDGGINIGEGCLCKLELEIIRAVNKRDIDHAERLAAQADQQSCKFYSKVLEHVKFLVKIKKTSPWMLDDESFKKEMERRDRAFNEKMAGLDRDFNKAMREHDEQTRKDDELWAQMSKNILENQMKIINGIIVSANPPAPGEPGLGDHPQSNIVFDEEEEEEDEMDETLARQQAEANQFFQEGITATAKIAGDIAASNIKRNLSQKNKKTDLPYKLDPAGPNWNPADGWGKPGQVSSGAVKCPENPKERQIKCDQANKYVRKLEALSESSRIWSENVQRAYLFRAQCCGYRWTTNAPQDIKGSENKAAAQPPAAPQTYDDGQAQGGTDTSQRGYGGMSRTECIHKFCPECAEAISLVEVSADSGCTACKKRNAAKIDQCVSGGSSSTSKSVSDDTGGWGYDTKGLPNPKVYYVYKRYQPGLKNYNYTIGKMIYTGMEGRRTIYGPDTFEGCSTWLKQKGYW